MKMDAEMLRKKARPSTQDEIIRRREQVVNASWQNRSAKIALRIRKELRVQGLSQSDLARLIGVTPPAVTKILSGKENLSLQTICKIEEALGTAIICTTTLIIQSTVAPRKYSYDLVPSEPRKLAELEIAYGGKNDDEKF